MPKTQKKQDAPQHKQKADKREELQTKYIQMQLLRQQFKEMAEQRNALIERVGELQTTIDALEKLDSVKTGSEMWSSIGSSAFVRSDIKDIDSVLIGVGAGVVVRKTRTQAASVLGKRMDDLRAVDNELLEEIAKFAQAIEVVEQQVEKLAEQVKEE